MMSPKQVVGEYRNTLWYIAFVVTLSGVAQIGTAFKWW